jgi:LacI family transcriptional regulator
MSEREQDTGTAVPPSRPATMKDVAEAAGVGLGTVSRVLTGNGQVSAAARERVMRAAQQLDYRPSALGRGLKLQRTNNIGLIVADISNNFYGEFAEGVLSAAKDLGKHVIVCASGEDPLTEREYADVLLQQRVDGIIAFPTGHNIDVWQGAQRLGVHVVFVDRIVDALKVPTLIVDNRGGSLAAADYLLALGHRRIGYLGGPQDLTSGREREEGFREAHRKAGVPVREELVVRARFTRDTAYASALRLIQADPAPTALFASNNVLGEAALAAIRDSGLRVPDDISVLMFDDVPWAGLITPPMTVVAQPARQMGDEAARLVLASDPPGGNGVRVLPYELIIRHSCRPWHAPGTTRLRTSTT